MFRRVLVPLDGTSDAESVLDHVRPLLASDGEAILLHVLPEPPSATGDFMDSWLALQKESEDYLARVPFTGFLGQVRTFVDVGDIAERIQAVGAATKADLIALTKHAWRGLPRAGLGRIARQVLRNADRDVFFVPPGRTPWDGSPKRILLPLEGPLWSVSEVEPVLHVATGLNAEVVILHVEPAETDPLEGRRIDPPLSLAAHDRERRYAEAADHLRSFGVEARSVIARGDPARQILAHAASLGAPMIAMTTHGRRGLERLVAGSVAESVIRYCDRPVLLLRVTPVPAAVSSIEWL